MPFVFAFAYFPLFRILPSMNFSWLRRPRRNRSSAHVRALTQETSLTTHDLIYPVFVKAGITQPEPIESMPGIFRHSLESLLQECREVAQLGIPAIALFPVIDPAHKTPEAEYALNPDQILYQALRLIKKEVPELILIADVALDPYTSHGHDGVLNGKGDVDNDATVSLLQRLAVVEAQAGADWVAPSDMMDGRVEAIRQALDRSNITETSILAYSAKFASAYYGPFRDAVGSSQKTGSGYLDKKTYQLNPANRREALLECQLDEKEGADILMVKPAGAYLDIIRELRHQTLLPIAAYQVSGEYAQIHAAAQKGWLDLEKTRDESLLAIKRAGADMILTYFAKEIARYNK
jgi:porphobilinogen synthase